MSLLERQFVPLAYYCYLTLQSCTLVILLQISRELLMGLPGHTQDYCRAHFDDLVTFFNGLE